MMSKIKNYKLFLEHINLDSKDNIMNYIKDISTELTDEGYACNVLSFGQDGQFYIEIMESNKILITTTAYPVSLTEEKLKPIKEVLESIKSYIESYDCSFKEIQCLYNDKGIMKVFKNGISTDSAYRIRKVYENINDISSEIHIESGDESIKDKSSEFYYLNNKYYLSSIFITVKLI